MHKTQEEARAFDRWQDAITAFSVAKTECEKWSGVAHVPEGFPVFETLQHYSSERHHTMVAWEKAAQEVKDAYGAFIDCKVY